MQSASTTTTVLSAALVALAFVLAPASAHAQLNTRPSELNEVGVDEHMLAQVPLDTSFRDHRGNVVSLGQYFDHRRPVILNLAYNRCPMLCSMVQNALVNGVRATGWTVGREFDIVTVSIDPRDTPADASHKRDSLLELYGRPEAQQGWHSLVGSESQIRRVADAVGFRYRYDERQNQYAHAAAIVLLTPDGRVARYLYGIEFNPNDIRLGLLEASQGRAINTVERLILFCYHYDPQGGRYVIVARRVMQLGGVLTIVLLGGMLAILWARERRKRHEPPPAGPYRNPTTPLAPPHDVRG